MKKLFLFAIFVIFIISLGFFFLVSAIPFFIVNSPFANSSHINTSFPQINISILESNLSNLTYNWEGTNYTFYQDDFWVFYGSNETNDTLYFNSFMNSPNSWSKINLSEGLILAMTMNNNSALGENNSLVSDLSGNRVNGTVYNAVWNSSGKYGGAYSFDGSGDYIATKSDFLNNTDAFTISVWTKPAAFSGWAGVIGKRVSDTNVIALQIDTGGDIYCDVDNGSTNSYCYSGNILSLNNWYHLVMVYNGSGATNAEKIKIYVNGTNISLTYSGTLPSRTGLTNTDVLNIGQLGPTSVNFYNGHIDDVKIWNRSLSASEVAQLYSSNVQKNSGNGWIFYVNQSKNATAGLDNLQYNYRVFFSNSSGSVNNTGLRYFTVDNTYPNINFVNNTPTNASSQANTSVIVNVSLIEKNLVNLTYNWNGTNYSMYDPSLLVMYNFDPKEYLKASFTMSTSGNSYYYRDLTSVSDYIIQSGDVLEYDILWTSSTDYIGVDYTTSDGTALRGSANDQNGLGAHPATDISAYALNKWYHRVIRLPASHVGKNITYYDIVSEKDNAGTVSSYLNNIMITDGAGNVRKLIWNNGSVTSALHISNSGSFVSLDNSTSITVASDSSLYSNNGVMTGTTWNTTGKYGGSMGFTSVNNNVAAINSINLTNAGTLSAWVYAYTLPFANPRILGSSGNVPVQLLVDNSYSKHNLSLYVNGRMINAPYTVTTGSWIFVAGTFNSSGVNIYVNGTKIYSDSTSSSGGSFTPLIGWNSVNNIDYWNGLIDEVRIWNRSLSDAEIYQQYASNLQKFNSTQWYLYVNQSKNATTGLDNGTYTYQIFANDSAGNFNSSEKRYITIGSVGPTISILSPVNGTNYNSGSVALNWSANQNVSWCGYSLDGAANDSSIIVSSARVVFNSTGSLQNWTVPAGVTSVNLKMWGAGGGGGYMLSPSSGGAGGFANGTLSVTPGQVLYIVVGGGGTGAFNSTASTSRVNLGGYGGGGSSCSSTYPHGGGAGGGYSGVFNSSTINQTNALIIAGGGGGGMSYSGTRSGGGGGLVGGGGTATGGTQSAGGTGGVSGSALQGANFSGSCGSDSYDGAGGGGGYFGGGGYPRSDGGDAGGGSGYLSSSIIGGLLVQGSNSTSTTAVAPAYTNDSDYSNLAGYSGNASTVTTSSAKNGYNGSVVISYTVSSGTTPTNKTLTSLSQGSHNITLFCNNTNGTFGQSNLVNFNIDTTAPNGTLISPANATSSSNTSYNFTANISDNIGIANATLNIFNSSGSLVNQTTISYPAGTLTATIGIVVNLVDGVYRWFYNIFDFAGNQYNTTNNTLTIANPDLVYPQFSNYQDNNATLTNSGIGLFNVTLANTNGTVLLEINNVNVSVTNISNLYSANYSFSSNGSYSYRWHSWGNGTNKNYNVSATRVYSVNYLYVQETPLSSDSNSTSEWRMRGRYNNHTGWDGVSFATISGLNFAKYTAGLNIITVPAVVNGYVYFGGADYAVYQLNASNVSQYISKYPLRGSSSSSPAVVNGYVYIGNIDKKLYQLNSSNISQKIKTFTAGSEIASSPAVANGYVYVGSFDKKIYQLNASDISIKISEYSSSSTIYSSPAVANGYVYVGGSDGTFYQLNASNISRVIALYITGSSIQSSPAVANGYVYVGSLDKKLYQLNASNVSQLIASYTTGDYVLSAPAVANGYVYVGSNDKKVYQLNASNVSQKIAEYTTGDSVQSSPAVANGYVYVGSNDKKVYQLNASNVSQKIAEYTTFGMVYSSPAVANGYVYVGGTDKNLYQLSASNISLSNIDVVPLAITIVSPLNSTYTTAVISFNISSNVAVSSCLVSLDGASNFSMTLSSGSMGANASNSSMSQGNHNITFSCNDTIGNMALTTRYFSVDSIAPYVAIVSPLNSSYSTKNILINVTNNSDARNIWFNRGLGNETYSSSITKTFNEGANTLYAYANDSAGNLNSTNVSFFVDSLSPTISVVSPIEKTYNVSTVNFNISTNENSTCWFALNSTDNYTMQTSNNRNFNYTLVLVGSPATNYAIIYYCNDSLNNIGTSSVNFGVRTTPPIISLNYPANNRAYTNSSVQFNYTAFASDGLDTCELWGNWSGAWEKNQSTTTISNGGENYFSVELGDGSYKWNIWCNNTIGQNDFSTQGNISFALDRNAPSVSFVSPVNITYNSAIRTISILSGSDANSVWYYNGTANVSYSGSIDLRLDDGSYAFTAYANDSAGNINSSSVGFIVDATSPNVSLNSPIESYSDDSAYLSSITFNCSAEENQNLSSISLYLSGSLSQTTNLTGTSNSASWTLTLAAGNYTWDCLASDYAGNSQFSNISRNIILNYTDLDNDGVSNSLDNLNGNINSVSIVGVGNLNISVEGNSSLVNFDEVKDVFFYEGSEKLFNFTHNFSSSQLDLSKVIITKGNDYLIVNLSDQLQSDYSKTVYLEDNNFISLCVKDTEISFISEMTDDCSNDLSEVNLDDCIGDSSGVTRNGLLCVDEGSTIRVENLRYSAIRGTSATPSEISTPGESLGGGGGGGFVNKSSVNDSNQNLECSKNNDCGEGKYCSQNKCFVAECTNNSQCSGDYYCFDFKCVKLFDMKIIELESPISAGSFIDFSYFIKAMANINNDVIVNFWIEKDGKKITSGKDTIFVGNMEEKTEKTKLFIPRNVIPGNYDLHASVSYEDYSAESHRQIEIISSKKNSLYYPLLLLVILVVVLVIIILKLERKKVRDFFDYEEEWVLTHKVSIGILYICIFSIGVILLLGFFNILSLPSIREYFVPVELFIQKIILPYVWYFFAISLTIVLISLIYGKKRKEYIEQNGEKIVLKIPRKNHLEHILRKIKHKKDLRMLHKRVRFLDKSKETPEEKKMREWEKKGYDTEIVNRRNPQEKSIEEWKMKGYDVDTIEKGGKKEQIERWRKKGYDVDSLRR